MPDILTDTGIVSKSYNSRGLFTWGAETRNLVRTASGVLWAAVRENLTNKWINIYRSDDNGFSWQRKYQGNLSDAANRKAALVGLNQNGNFMHLTYHEHEDRLILWHGYYDQASGLYGIEPYVFDVDSSGDLTRQTAAPATDTLTTNQDQLAFDVAYNADTTFLTMTIASDLYIYAMKPYIQSSQGAWTQSGPYYNVFSTVCDEDNNLHVVILKDNTSSYDLMHTKLNKASGLFTTPTTVKAQTDTNTILDVSLDMDSYGNLCVGYTIIDSNGDANVEVALSVDSGASWDVESIPSTTGQSSYTDNALQSDIAGTTILGGIGGFMLGYTRDYEGTPTSYLRTILTDDGTNYTIGAQKQAVESSEPVTAVKFFRSPGTQLQDLSDIGQIRIGYQTGEGNSTLQLDTVPVVFGQQLLKTYAYADESSAYTTDVADDDQVLVSVNIVDGVVDQDYYNLGLTGNITTRYITAFEKVGTRMKFRRYEPKSTSELNDRTAYELNSTSVCNAVLDVMSYELPIIPDQSDFDEYIERDIRKIYLPPDFYLGRNFILNEGNYLKRTVWLVYYDGNAYELSQVVPYFIDNQIVLYTANAYVVGPSRDPFARTVLPSET